MKGYNLFWGVTLSCAVLLALPVYAGWHADGQSISTAPDVQEHAFVISDGMGGVIFVWSDYRNGDWDVYAQRVDACGNALWMQDGVPICTVQGAQLHGSATNWFTATDHFRPISPDGMGGAIIAWHDGRGNDLDIYVQRVDHSGNVMWGANGIAIATVAGMDEVYPTLMPDGVGGAYVSWTLNSGLVRPIYTQRVAPNGNSMWAAGGVLITNSRGAQRPELVSDGAGGAIIMWMDYRHIGSDIYGQRVDPNGNVLWTPNGVGIRVGPGIDDYFHAIVSDGAGGAIVAFQWQPFGGHPNHRIYAQRVDAAGNLLWPAPGGVPISTLGGSIKQQAPGIVTDGAGGAIINWWDNRNGNWDVFAQRIDPSGAAQWALHGIPVCAASGLQGYPVNTAVWTKTIDMISDGVGGAILTWHDFRGPNGDIYVQRIDGNGTELWTHDGIAMCAAPSDQTVAGIAIDDGGGGIVVWQDERGVDTDIYSQRITASGTFISDYALDIKPRSCPNPLNVKIFDMEPPPNAKSKKGGVLPVAVLGCDVSQIDASSLLLEGVAPLRHSYEDVTVPVQNGDECDCITAGPDGTVDLTLKFLKRDIATAIGAVSDGDVIPLTLTGQLLDGTPFQASDCVIILSKGAQLEISIESNEVRLAPAIPNPFNPVSRIGYYLPREEFVKLSVYDVTGKLLERLVSERQPAGEYVLEWNATRFSSGIYFYRIEAGDFTEARKIILLK